jgi:hypothetical protein
LLTGENAGEDAGEDVGKVVADEQAVAMREVASSPPATAANRDA